MSKSDNSKRQEESLNDTIYTFEKVSVIGFKTSWIDEFKDEMKSVYESKEEKKNSSPKGGN